MINRSGREGGLSAIAVIGVMLLLSILGMSVVSMVTGSHETRVEQITYQQAVFANQAGLEYAMRKTYEGRNPLTARQTFGRGNFRVDRQGNRLVVTASVGGSRVIHSAQEPTQADCLSIDTSQSHTHRRGTEIRRIYLTKRCLPRVVLDKMIFSWEADRGESYDRVRLDDVINSRIYDAPPRVRSGALAELIDAALTDNNDRYRLSEIRFPVDMRNRSFRIQFFLGDGSQKETSFTLGPCPHSSC